MAGNNRAVDIDDIKELKNEIIACKKDIPPETWDRLVELLDKIFLAYSIKARELNIGSILEDLDHYERQHGHLTNVHLITQSVRYIIDSESYEKAKYRFEKLWREEINKETE